MDEKEIGKVTHFFSKISVAVIELTQTLKVGDTIHFYGHESDFTQKVESMQVEHKNIQEAQKGHSIGLKTDQPVKEGCVVYLSE